MTTRVIAIDGPAYVGKSVIAKELSTLTRVLYINTGHMYRAVAKVAIEKGIEPSDANAVTTLARSLDIQFRNDGSLCRTLVKGQDWTQLLDSYDLVLFASKISDIQEVRNILTDIQRSYTSKQTIVMEGRDIGSVVFPDAAWKFFITASIEIRAERMYKMMDLKERAHYSNALSLIPKLEALDQVDRNRKISPLIMAEDAIVYDNSDSPSATQDALVLQYYVTHPDEIIKNSQVIQLRYQGTKSAHGIDR